MRQGRVFCNGIAAGIITEDAQGYTFAYDEEYLNRQMVQRIFNRFIPLKEKWFACIDASFISEQQKMQFKELISKRIETLSMPF